MAIKCCALVVVSPLSSIPTYQQLVEVLRERINSGQWYTPSLPTERSLAAEFNIGRDTVRDALAVLRDEGLIEKRRGQPAQVRISEPRQAIVVASGATITARMPVPEERVEWQIPFGVPMLVVNDQAYPAHRFELLTR